MAKKRWKKRRKNGDKMEKKAIKCNKMTKKLRQNGEKKYGKKTKKRR